MENSTKMFVVQTNDTYIFIDYIYLSDFLETDFSDLESRNLKEEFLILRNKIFKYSDNPFGLYKMESSFFELKKIRPIEVADIDSVNVTQFCSDSGLILVINLNKFFIFLKEFDDVKLFESIEGIGNLDYWPKINAKYPSDIYYFFTVDIDPDSAGSGNFEIL